MRFLALAAVLWALALPALAETPAQLAAKQDCGSGILRRPRSTTRISTRRRKYLSPRYKQHNPTLLDGADGIKKLIETLRARAPTMHVEIKHIFAVDDFVIVHSHSVTDPAKPGRAIADFYRMKDGLIEEHWDVIEDIPDHSANDNGMF